MKNIFHTGKTLLNDVKSWLKKENLVSQTQPDLMIILNEVIQNIYRHAYQLQDDQKIEISYTKNTQKIHFEIIDYAPKINLEFMHKTFVPSETGGMGLNIIRQNSEQFEIKHLDTGHLTKIVFKN